MLPGTDEGQTARRLPLVTGQGVVTNDDTGLSKHLSDRTNFLPAANVLVNRGG